MPKYDDPKDVKLPRVTKGKRPYFFEDPSIDQMMTFIIELMTEVLVLRDRQDTVERLLSQKGVVRREDVEGFAAEADVEAERSVARDALVKRVLRIHSPEGRLDD